MEQSSEEEEELNLSDAGVVEKYKLAGGVVNTVMAALIAQVKVGDRSSAVAQLRCTFFFFFLVVMA